MPPPWPWRVPRAWAVLALLLVVGLGARAWRPDALGLGHYDEGVYAASARGVMDPVDRHLFPGQERFSPPVWFVGVGVVARITGAPTADVALTLNILVGATTAVVAGVLSWGWFGPVTGAATAALLAANQYHIMLDRTALTDPTFALLMLLAVAALGRGLARHSLRWCVAGGLLTGLAWNTKYHGWFVLVIGLLAIIIARWRLRGTAEGRGLIRRAVPGLAVAGVVAGLVYLPWAVYVGRSAVGGGGWRGILEYYLGLIGPEWVGNAAQHLALQAYLDGPLTRASIALGMAAGLLLGPVRLRGGFVAGACLAGASAWLTGGLPWLILLTAVGAVSFLRSTPPMPAWLLLGWVVLWVIAAPLYHPYARLLLPAAVAAAILAGRGLDQVIHGLSAAGAGGVRREVAAAGLAAIAILLLWTGGLTGLGPARTWADGGHTRRGALLVAARVPEAAPIIVIGEPSLAYYLQELGRPARELTESVRSLDSLGSETFVVAGRYADRAPALREGLQRLGPRLERLGRLPFEPTDVRLLDDLVPAMARRYRAAPDTSFDFRLYRLAPAESIP